MRQRPKDLEFIEFNGGNSLDFNIGITSHYGILGAPEPDVTVQSVPGKSGDLIIDNKRYKNVTIKFEAYIVPESPQFETKCDGDLNELCYGIRDWLLYGGVGYKILRSSKQPGYFRYARLSNKLDIEDILFQVGKVTLTFDCKPFMYSDAGMSEIEIEKDSSCELFNIENEEAMPKIIVKGNGNVTFALNDKEYNVSGVQDILTIDSEMGTCYSATKIEEGKFESPDFTYPKLQVGSNVFSCTADEGIEKVSIVPNWRRK